MPSEDKWGRDKWEVEEERKQKREIDDALGDYYSSDEYKNSPGWVVPRKLSEKIVCTLLLLPFLYFSLPFTNGVFESSSISMINKLASLVVPGIIFSTILLIWLKSKLLKFLVVGGWLLIIISFVVYLF